MVVDNISFIFQIQTDCDLAKVEYSHIGKLLLQKYWKCSLDPVISNVPPTKLA